MISGADHRCRAHLTRGRWPEGFRCARCGHERAYSHQRRLIEECAACGKQHSLLAGTMFEQTKTGLARWFLAIWLVTSSKGGISALELQRQMGFGSYQTAWAWLHKIRKAMVRPDRRPLAERVEADETLVGGARPGRRGRGAAGKTVVAGAVEAGRGKSRGRRLGRLRLQSVADASAESLKGFLTANVAPAAAVTTDGWQGYAGLGQAGYDHEAINLRTSWGDAVQHLPAIHLVFGLAKRWLARHAPRRGQPQAPPGPSRRACLPIQPPHRQEHRPLLRQAGRAGHRYTTSQLQEHRRPSRRSLRVMES